MVATTLNGVLLTGDHSSRPTATTVAKGTLYACSTHTKLYQSDASSWSDWFTSAAAGGGELVATSTIWDAKGDLAAGTGADAASKLTVGANDKVLTAASGQTTGLIWNYPPGYELDYVEFTSNVNCTATTEATANTIVTSSTVAYDGSTVVLIEFWCPAVFVQATAGASMDLWLYEKVGAGAAASIGKIGEWLNVAANGLETPAYVVRRMTPSNASIIYSIRGSTSSGTSIAAAGAGGNGNAMPGFIRITRK